MAPSRVINIDFIYWYMCCMTHKHFPFIRVFRNECHRPSLHTLSKSCLKSINAQDNFFLFAFEYSIRLSIIKRLTDVLNPLRNTAWQELKFHCLLKIGLFLC